MTAGAVQVQIGSRSFDYPAECPCCGGEPDDELLIARRRRAHAVADDSATAISFPYCRRCIAHVKAWDVASMTSAGIMVVGIIAAVIVGATVHPAYGLIAFFGAIIVASALVSRQRSQAKAQCMPSCACASRAVAYDGWSGVASTFAFESATYTARFAEQNAPKLVSASAQLRKLLEAYKVARQQVPTPASATRTVPPPRDRDEWLTHLGEQHGRVARRMAITRALAVVHDPTDRAALLQTVCKAELQPLLDRVAGLDAARARRHIEEALAEIRADNLPDELRAAELSELETRLRFSEFGPGR